MKKNFEKPAAPQKGEAQKKTKKAAPKKGK